MAVINTNVKALFTQNALKVSGREQSVAMQQLSTGKRINSARDDAAGLAISKQMTQQIRSMNMAIRNAGDAVSLIQTAEGATGAITDMLQRMRELAVQAINDTNSGDQRGYLDLEFQQLKQQIVSISQHTEWNGFPLLNGTVGEPVGERPVYKTVAAGDFDTIFIDPTTTRSIAGADSGEKQTITITGTPAAGTLVVGGVTVTIAATDNTVPKVAEKIVSALKASDAFGPSSGRDVSSDAAGLISIKYKNTEGTNGDVLDVTKTDGAGVTLAVASPVKAVGSSAASTVETFTNAGKFLSSGTLSITVPSLSADGAVTAKFVDSLGVETTLTGTADIDAGLITFASSAGNNSKIISDTLTYTLKDPAGAASDLTSRAVSLTVDVAGSIAPIKTGDIVFVKRDASGKVIDRISIPESEARNDKLSPPNNAAGSAIAIAAAINSKTADTGIAAVVNKNVMVGAPMSGATVMEGNLVINGYSTPAIKTIYNNPRDTRTAVVDAINFISAQTGVVAINTGTDGEGIRLEAADGRNIEISYANLSGSAADFAARTGVRAGVQASTYSLEARVETAIEIESIAGGDIGRARLTAGAYTDNISALITTPRSTASLAADIKTLGEGDLIINGVTIPGTTSLDDKKTNTQSLSSGSAGSALAIATAINSKSEETGVTATAMGATTQGTAITRAVTTGTQSLYVNGIEVKVDFAVGATTTDRLNEVVKQINLKVGEHGTQASTSPNGTLKLETVDGRNLSVWFNSTGSLTASEFGLGSAAGVTPMTPSGTVTAANFTGAATVYGRVTLSSETDFEIKPGTNGFTGNFTALGFQQGVFGGEVDQATSKMTPPNVGRLSFHVGASATQTIHIDFADYGAGGPITGDITGDVALSETAARVNRIDSGEAARNVLAKLDVALDKVNGNRAVMGAVMNRLDYIMDNLANVSMNTEASRSQIEDADYAKASTDMARTQIMQQAATAVLAQANMDQQTVLKLLQ
jgi:flagellin